MILVTGATGTVGSEVIARLLPSHAGRIAALTRNAGAVFPDGVEKVVGDLGRSDLVGVLRGVEAVFLLSAGLDIAAHDRRLAAAASETGVHRIVKLSALGVGHGSTDPITSWHRAGEDAIRDSGVAWTFLRPTGFMSNALNWAPTVASQRTVYAPFAGGRTAVVDPADIGAVAAQCLIEARHENKVFELTGPEPLSPSTQVDILARVLGQDVSYVEVDPAAALEQMTAYGMPHELAYAVIELLRSSQEPFNSEISDDIAAVTGRPARDFEDWAQAHRSAFIDVGTSW